jgi:hypothetical protein
VVYLYWPETARLSLEEVAKNFGDEVAVHVPDMDEESRFKVNQGIEKPGTILESQSKSTG